MDKLDFLEGSQEPVSEAVTETPVVETPVETPAIEEPVQQETAEQKETRERDERGRFKPKETEKEPVMVPLQALHETRDELKSLKAQLEALQNPQQQPETVPDIFENPEGYQSYQQEQLRKAVLNTTLNLSEEMTTQSVGAETVEAAKQWGATAFQANPALYQQFLSRRNPYGFLVQQYQKETTLQKLGDDPSTIEQFLAWRQAQQQLGTQPAATPQTQPTPAPSIASAPSAGGVQTIPTGPGVAFFDTIK